MNASEHVSILSWLSANRMSQYTSCMLQCAAIINDVTSSQLEWLQLPSTVSLSKLKPVPTREQVYDVTNDNGM